MRAHPSVQSVEELDALSRAQTDGGARYPDDGPGFLRADDLSGTPSAWMALALRLPQAWACETGLYGGANARIAFLEQNFPISSAFDLRRFLTSPVVRATNWRASVPPGLSNADKYDFELHGHQVAGMIAAEGDSGSAVAAPLWSSDLRVFSMESTNSKLSPGVAEFAREIQSPVVASQPRVLSLSSDFGPYRSLTKLKKQTSDMKQLIAELMTSVPQLLVVKSAGNDTISGSCFSAPVSKRTAILSALIELRDSTMDFRKRILIVGTTDRLGKRWVASNALRSVVELYAPGVDVESVDPAGTSSGPISGTSFATPLVASIAGQLLTMDSTLTAAKVKELLLAGARDSVEGPNGDNMAPSPVGNTSDIVYEADSYGSLRTLSSQAGRPLCGATVTTKRNAYPRFDRNPSFAVLVRRYQSTAVETLANDTSAHPLLWPGN